MSRPLSLSGIFLEKTGKRNKQLKKQNKVYTKHIYSNYLCKTDKQKVFQEKVVIYLRSSIGKTFLILFTYRI